MINSDTKGHLGVQLQTITCDGRTSSNIVEDQIQRRSTSLFTELEEMKTQINLILKEVENSHVNVPNTLIPEESEENMDDNKWNDTHQQEFTLIVNLWNISGAPQQYETETKKVQKIQIIDKLEINKKINYDNNYDDTIEKIVIENQLLNTYIPIQPDNIQVNNNRLQNRHGLIKKSLTKKIDFNQQLYTPSQINLIDQQINQQQIDQYKQMDDGIQKDKLEQKILNQSKSRENKKQKILENKKQQQLLQQQEFIKQQQHYGQLTENEKQQFNDKYKQLEIHKLIIQQENLITDNLNRKLANNNTVVITTLLETNRKKNQLNQTLTNVDTNLINNNKANTRQLIKEKNQLQLHIHDINKARNINPQNSNLKKIKTQSDKKLQEINQLIIDLRQQYNQGRIYSNFHRIIENYTQQKKGAGITTMSNYRDLNQIHSEQNSDKLQILKLQIGVGYILIFSWHRQKEQDLNHGEIISTIYTAHEQQENCYGTIIITDLNQDVHQGEFSGNKHIKKILKHFEKVSTDEKTRGDKSLDNIFISKKALKKIINKQEIIKNIININKESDHKPIQIIIKIKLTEQPQLLPKITKNARTEFLNIKIARMVKQQEPDQFQPLKVIKTINQIENILIRINSKKHTQLDIIKMKTLYFKRQINQKIALQLIDQKTQDGKYIDQFHKNKIYIQAKIQELKKELINNKTMNTKEYYRKIKNIFKMNERKEIIEIRRTMYDNDNRPITNEQQQIEMVKEYFDEHYEQKNIKDNPNLYTQQLNDNEINNLIENIDPHRIAEKKACAHDGLNWKITSRPKQGRELPKTVLDVNRQQIHNERNRKLRLITHEKQKANLQNLLKIILSDQQQQDRLLTGRQVYITKDPMKQQIKNCRPITILSTMAKLIESSIIKQVERLTQQGVIKPIDNKQSGFQKNNSTTICITKLLQKIKQAQSRMRNLPKSHTNNLFTTIFYDFKSAFDSPRHVIAFENFLIQQNYPRELINQITWFYFKVKINGNQIGRGVLQGGIFSPRLFIQYLQAALEIFESRTRDLGLDRIFSYLAFADDIAIIYNNANIEDIRSINGIFENTMNEFGLQLNKKKCEVLNLRSRNSKLRTEQNLQLNQCLNTDINGDLVHVDDRYKITDEFKYLGIIIQGNGNLKLNIKKIEQKMNKFKYLINKVANVIGNHSITLNLWKSFIRSQFVYGISSIINDGFITNKHKIENLYSKFLVETMGIKGLIKGEQYINMFRIPNLKDIDIQYREHILRGLQKLDQEQKQYWDVEILIDRWNQEKIKHNIEDQFIYQDSKKQIYIMMTHKRINHLSRNILNSDGSIKLIQQFLKIRSKRKSFVCQCGSRVDYYEKHTTHDHSINNQVLIKRQQSLKPLVQTINQWDMDIEIMFFIDYVITQDKGFASIKDQKYDTVLVKQYLKHMLPEFQRIINEYNIICQK